MKTKVSCGMAAADHELSEQRHEHQSMVSIKRDPTTSIFAESVKLIWKKTRSSLLELLKPVSSSRNRIESGHHDHPAGYHNTGTTIGHSDCYEVMLKEFAFVTQVYLIMRYADLRRGIDGLAEVIQRKLSLNPLQ